MADPLPTAAELNTWQEIATYLGISVREAQNREKSDGMPVRRLPGKKPRVWALRSELDAWKARVGSLTVPDLVGSPSGGETLGPDPAIIDPESSRRRGLTRRALVSVAGTAVAAVGVAAFLKGGRRDPVRAAIAGNSVCAWDRSDSLLWKYPFHEPLQQNFEGYGILKNPKRQAQLVDFRGDGHKDIVVATAFPQPQGVSPDREEVYCFSSDGRLRWRYRPQLSFTFGETKFSGPWTLTDAIIAPDSDGRDVVWLSVAHYDWHPSALITLDANGAPKVRFVSAGNIYVLYHAVNPAGSYILAGGVNNEYPSAALAVLRADAPPSRSPQTAGTRFECVDGPTGVPDRYFRFPPSELNAANNEPYNSVGVINKSEALYVWATEIRYFVVAAAYRFSGDIEPVSVALDDGFAAWHRRFQVEGRLNHDLAHCPHLTRPTAVRRWDAQSGWRSLEVPANRSSGPSSGSG